MNWLRSIVVLLAAFVAVSDNGVARGYEGLLRQNLHFMEWWLSNHRERGTAKKAREGQ